MGRSLRAGIALMLIGICGVACGATASADPAGLADQTSPPAVAQPANRAVAQPARRPYVPWLKIHHKRKGLTGWLKHHRRMKTVPPWLKGQRAPLHKPNDTPRSHGSKKPAKTHRHYGGRG